MLLVPAYSSQQMNTTVKIQIVDIYLSGKIFHCDLARTAHATTSKGTDDQPKWTIFTTHLPAKLDNPYNIYVHVYGFFSISCQPSFIITPSKVLNGAFTHESMGAGLLCLDQLFF